MNSMDYYVLGNNGQQNGPYSFAQLQAMWSHGDVNIATPYWREGMVDWRPLREIENALRPLQPVPVMPPLPLPPLPSSGRQLQNSSSGICLPVSSPRNLAIKSAAVGAAVGLAHHSLVRRSPVSSGLWGLLAASCFYQGGGTAGGAFSRLGLAVVRVGVFLLVLLGLLIGFILFAAFLGSLVPQHSPVSGVSSSSSSNATSASSEAGAIYSAPSQDEAIKRAKKFLAGTWSGKYTDGFWNKLVFQEDGTMQSYISLETDNEWGAPGGNFTCEIYKSTYTDTGEVYYAFHATGKTTQDGVLNGIIEQDGTLTVRRGDNMTAYTLTRGDSSPLAGK